MTPESKLLRSFGRESAGTSLVFRPGSEGAVYDIFKLAKAKGQRIVARAGGHSFHDQALHRDDDGKQIVICTKAFNAIKPHALNPNLVTLGAGVAWIDYLTWALQFPTLRLPGSMQTARHATAGGTMSGNCLSRFSAVLGKESQWIESFRIATTGGTTLNASRTENPDLFFAAIGGCGYLGFVLDVTYRTVPIDSRSCARTSVSTFTKLTELVEAQCKLAAQATSGPTPLPPRAISSAWFSGISNIFDPDKIKGAVFDSTYALPSNPPAGTYPLYEDTNSCSRYVIELMARLRAPNIAIHEFLFEISKNHIGCFENDLQNFLFFMDGNTVAKERFEKEHPGQLFPIAQQTYVVPVDKAVAFAERCESLMREKLLRPAESDMLLVAKDEAIMSANYNLTGFAITLAFEPIRPSGKPPGRIKALFKELSVECLKQGGRLHLTKNLFVDRDVFRKMFALKIEEFEKLKRKYDPDLLLQNPLSDYLFQFKK